MNDRVDSFLLWEPEASKKQAIRVNELQVPWLPDELANYLDISFMQSVISYIAYLVQLVSPISCISY